MGVFVSVVWGACGVGEFLAILTAQSALLVDL